MGGTIFISYRRGADSGFAGRLYDRLEHAFGRERVFMDVDSIAPGEDFVAVLESRVAECDVLLALIGRGWLAATDAAGRLRLDNPDDFVRIEIAAALAQGKRVIPVLTDDVPMPRAEHLPAEMRPLARRQAIRLTHDRFGDDAARLVRAVERALTGTEAARQAEETARRKADEEVGQRREVERQRAEEEAHRQAEAEAATKAEEDRQRTAAEAARRAQDQERQRAEEKAKPGEEKRGSRVPIWAIAGATVVVIIVLVILGIIGGESSREGEAVLKKQRTEVVAPGDAFRDCDVCPQMVALPGGTFLMGSSEDEEERRDNEGPQHEVTVEPFTIGKYEVTFEEWDACVAAGGCNGYRPDDRGWGRGRRPVINVSWIDAQAYIDWLAEATGKPYRLPSEAEWEYAARAGTTTRYAFGDEITEKDANFGANVGRTTEVGAYPANAWGLYDMHGNVWEWVEDVWHDSYEGAPADGSAWTGGKGKNSSRNRVLRGDSWDFIPGILRSAGRGWSVPETRNRDLGFRVARTLD